MVGRHAVQYSRVIDLACPVRACAEPLELGEQLALRCRRGHSFDRARPGYWNLLQPQDRRSATPGDSPDAMAARRRWIDAGRADPLVAELRRTLAGVPLGARPAVVDLGCGDGALLARVLVERDVELCGIDVSATAIKSAARVLPGATWIVANADRRLPLADGSTDLALSLFGRRNGPELQRILRPAGVFVVAVPGADDLIELREAVQGRALRLDRVPATLAALAAEFDLAERRTSSWAAILDAHGIADALALTYRGARRRERERTRSLSSIAVTLSAELLVFRSRSC